VFIVVVTFRWRALKSTEASPQPVRTSSDDTEGNREYSATRFSRIALAARAFRLITGTNREYSGKTVDQQKPWSGHFKTRPV
jgi:hypothetical protein